MAHKQPAKMWRTALSVQVFAVLVAAAAVTATPWKHNVQMEWTARVSGVTVPMRKQVNLLSFVSDRQGCDNAAANKCIKAFQEGNCFDEAEKTNEKCCASFNELADCVDPLLSTCPSLQSSFEDTAASAEPVCNAASCVPVFACLQSDCSPVEKDCEDVIGNAENVQKCCDSYGKCATCAEGLSEDCLMMLPEDNQNDIQKLKIVKSAICADEAGCDLSFGQCIEGDFENLCDELGQVACCRKQMGLVDCVEKSFPSCFDVPDFGEQVADGRDEIVAVCEPILARATPVPTPTTAATTTPTPMPSTSTGPDATEEPSSGPSPTTSSEASPSAIQSGTPIPQETRTQDDNLSDGGNSTCFPADATVEMADGSTKTIGDLKTGDRVRAAHNVFSDVFMFTHRHPDAVSSMVRLELATTQLELSLSHYLPVGGRLVAAESIVVGDELDMSDGSSQTVRAVSRVQKIGLFNPHTVDGRIAVNGVVASTLTRSVEPRLALALLWVPRTVYRVFGVGDALGRMLYAHNDWIAGYVPSGQTVIA
eukprot:Plantae.Rhodophyta-Purpureofilum_apyrenoidigerum.ctg38327.p1 GENE.Plantae.Rhodophyta-Purpureofilum_apyrenoidigerum.ctg38327~~Plantae.Rhodophyta-Purpureofilum_apyrenoidigerum.ctg38327.p1  ORF type:complete len:546 (-),score=66.38 Plantae.Rhodophyta-Purpureofilum_apyrenoidigerum.ctg38327:298-1908(-)